MVFTVESYCNDPRSDSAILETMIRRTELIKQIEVKFTGTATPQHDLLNVFWEEFKLDRAMLPILHRLYELKVWAWVEIFEGEDVTLVLEYEAEQVAMPE